jgi:predicted lipoprotein with Yx(FWY)xxD motif
MKRFYMFTVLALLALLLAACPGEEPTNGTGAEAPAETPVVEATEPAAEVEATEPAAEVEATEPAAEEEPTEPAAEEEETPEVEATAGVTDTTDITDTAEMTETPEIEATDEVTATEEMTDTSEMDTGEGAMAALNISESDTSGPYLADAEGYTLYTYTGADESQIDTSMWEPVEASDADTVGEGLDESLLGSVDRDGVQQLTYNNYPLYRYTGDAQPGDMSGQGMDESWYALSDLGEPIQE